MKALIEKDLIFCEATASDFDFIKEHIKKFELDDRDLHYHQFTIAKYQNAVVGFGRIRQHNGCDEFCSLGVVEEKRFNGIARALVLNKTKNTKGPLYLVCIIPEFFVPLGFKIVTDFPPEMQDKLDYCRSELTVEEEYVVMKKV